MSWWDSSRAGHGTQLLRAAAGLAEHGWPVLPGTFWQAGAWHGRPDAPQAGPVPVDDGLPAATVDRSRATAWWSGLPYSILLATGSALDVIEVAADVGRRVRALLRTAGVTAPTAATTDGRWWFAVAAGEPMRPELASEPGVVLYGSGSFAVAPPSADTDGTHRWEIGPWACRWRLPRPVDVQWAVLAALGQRQVAEVAAVGS